MNRPSVIATLVLCIVSGAYATKQAVGASSVDLTSGKFEEDVTDISVKVAGGYVSLTRTYEDNQWSFNKYWGDLVGESDSGGSLSAIVKNGITYQNADQVGHVFSYGNDYTIYRNVSGSATNFRWQARSGDWKEYDASGRLQVYGNRNNVKVLLMRDAMNNVVGVQDHFTNQVLWIARDENGRVASVSDAASGGRTVAYAYDGAGRLTNAVDVLGHSTRYGYDASGRLNTVC